MDSLINQVLLIIQAQTIFGKDGKLLIQLIYFRKMVR